MRTPILSPNAIVSEETPNRGPSSILVKTFPSPRTIVDADAVGHRRLARLPLEDEALDQASQDIVQRLKNKDYDIGDLHHDTGSGGISQTP